MMDSTRRALRELVCNDPTIDLMIVHHAGGNDFFSSKPEVEECERERVIAICQEIIASIPRRTVRVGGCRGESTSRGSCPADWGQSGGSE